ncbi:ribosome silencing factor [Sphingobacteriaceae bacterium]|nr:ribosome silencing factor [Sphingobacteriaceae bacterium]
MAKKPVTKIAAKKTSKSPAKKTTAKSSGSSKKVLVKKSVGGAGAKKSAVKVKKPLTDKERELREANVIANSENKKKPSTTKRPKKTSTAKQTTGLLDSIVEGMQERKAKNIQILNLQGLENRVTDYFVICDAESNTHVNSIADSVEETVEKMTSERPYHSEGQQNGEWILIDYINIVVHVFLREAREHYNIEGLWGDAEITEVKD